MLCLLAMKLVALLVSLTLSLDAQREQAALTLDQLCGAWKLVRIETERANGETLPPYMGEGAVGTILYDRSGEMSVQVMSAKRKNLAGGSWENAPLAELRETYGSYYAYHGGFEIVDGGTAIIHRIRGSLRPSETGSELRRAARLVAGRLVLTSPVGPDGTFNRITWERIP